MPETCENCGNPIGALETPCLHNDHVVCYQCKKLLSEQAPKPSQFTDPEANARAGAIIVRVIVWGIAIICLIAVFQKLAAG